MIGEKLRDAIFLARTAHYREPALFRAALDRVTDQVDRLLEMQGEAAAPLRHTGQRMAVLLHAIEAGGQDPAPLLASLIEEAKLAARLERLLPMRGAPLHWLPQVAAGRAHNTPFTVIQGGRR